MINLFNLNNHIIDTSKYSNLLHDKIVNEFEETIANYVGAKYAATFNSATSAIFLLLTEYKGLSIKVPSMIPPVVLNAIITSGNDYEFYDDVNWVGDSYLLHDFGDYKVIDSAQKLEKDQFKKECNSNDLMIFSFYPTKPVGSCDGGMIVSDDFEKIKKLKELALNGMSYSPNNWERKINFVGYKMYMNSMQCDIALKNFNLYSDKLEKLKTIRELYNKELGYNNTSNHLYRIEVNERDKFINFMKNSDISCGIHYESMHLHPVYLKHDANCPNSEEKSKLTVSIPFHELLTNSEIYHIIDKVNEYKNGK
jgi:perosamine synthetase